MKLESLQGGALKPLNALPHAGQVTPHAAGTKAEVTQRSVCTLILHGCAQGANQQGASAGGYQGQAFQAGGGGGTGYAQGGPTGGAPAAAGYQQSAYQGSQQNGYQAPAPPSSGATLLSDAQKLLSRLQTKQADGTAGPERGLAERDDAGALVAVQGQGLSPGRALAEGAAAPAGGSTTQNTVLALAGAASNAWNRLSRVPGAGERPEPRRFPQPAVSRHTLRLLQHASRGLPCNAWS